MQIGSPLIETARLKLRLPATDDKESIHAIWSDPEVTKFIPVILFKTPEEIAEFIQLSLQRWQERGFGIFAVTLKDTGEMVGYCGLQYLDNTPEVEIYYGFSTDVWNKGMATEAAKAVLRFGFEALNLDSIAAITLPANTASQNVLEKIGLTKAPQMRTFRENDCVYYTASRQHYSSNGDHYQLTYHA